MPPVARMGKPGRAFAMADTARNAIGRMAFPAQMQANKNNHISLLLSTATIFELYKNKT